MRGFEDLKVWQNAQELTVSIYQMLSQNHDYGFKDQIQRAAVSIMNNIAEGCDSGTDAQFDKFLRIAKGSCAETRSMLYLAHSLGYCDNDLKTSLIGKSVLISKQLDKLRQSLKAPANDQ